VPFTKLQSHVLCLLAAQRDLNSYFAGGIATLRQNKGASNELEPMELPDKLVAALGVRLISPLGGRLNRHWLVESPKKGSDERRVLRRWSPQPAGSIEVIEGSEVVCRLRPEERLAITPIRWAQLTRLA
jgi:hypothetical protein